MSDIPIPIDDEEPVDAQRPYRPFGRCLDLFYNRDQEVCIHGPAGTGKTRAMLEKLHFCCLAWPGTRALLIRKTRNSLTQTTLPIFENEVVVENDPMVTGRSKEGRSSYQYPMVNGKRSELALMGTEDPEKVKSGQFDIIGAEECTEFSLHDWEMLLRALRGGAMPYNQIIGACNPNAPKHWLRLRMDEGKTSEIKGRYEDNPVLWDHAKGEWTRRGRRYIAILDNMTGHRYLRLRLGLWRAAEGVVYPEWDPAIHVLDQFSIPVSWPRFRVIDFGYTNPFVCQWWALDADGRAYRYRETYETQVTVSRHAAEINALTGSERILDTVCDHDAEDRATLVECGIRNVKAYKGIERGIQAVRDRLMVQADGRPRLFMLRDSLVRRDEKIPEGKPWCSDQEWDGYVWPVGVDARPIKEVPVPVDDHGMDCVRYIVAHLDLKRGVRKAGGSCKVERISTDHASPIRLYGGV